MNTGLPLLVALIEFGVIVWLWLSRRNDRRKISDLTLRARRAELRSPDAYFDGMLDALHAQDASRLIHEREKGAK